MTWAESERGRGVERVREAVRTARARHDQTGCTHRLLHAEDGAARERWQQRVGDLAGRAGDGDGDGRL